jgi:hypothetical protein
VVELAHGGVDEVVFVKHVAVAVIPGMNKRLVSARWLGAECGCCFAGATGFGTKW